MKLNFIILEIHLANENGFFEIAVIGHKYSDRSISLASKIILYHALIVNKQRLNYCDAFLPQELRFELKYALKKIK